MVDSAETVEGEMSYQRLWKVMMGSLDHRTGLWSWVY